jgi:hypothetical protein
MPAAFYSLCGFVFGLSMLIRPIAVGVVVVLAAIVWFMRRELTRRTRCLLVTMLLLGNLAAVFPWEAWVYVKTGNVISLSTNGVKAVLDGFTFAVETKGYRQDIGVPPDVAQVMDDIRAREGEITTFSDLIAAIYREVLVHPVAVTKLLLLKMARSWYGTDSQRMERPILLIQLAYLGLIVWGARSAWKRGGLPRHFTIGALLVVAYFWCMTFLALSILRYMVPAVGLLFIVVAARFPQKIEKLPNAKVSVRFSAHAGSQ